LGCCGEGARVERVIESSIVGVLRWLMEGYGKGFGDLLWWW